MRIALTGSSSSGKSTLINELMKLEKFNTKIERCVSIDARAIIKSMGHHSMDIMSKDETMEFQIRYFIKKKDIEKGSNNFITDRSFIDIAAYWIVRDNNPEEPVDNNIKLNLLGECRHQSLKYDIHFYLPFGIIPFKSDGYRSEDILFHQMIDLKIMDLLYHWNINFITLKTADINKRVSTVLSWLATKNI
jgi:nicotinamide riboside kinase